MRWVDRERRGDGRVMVGIGPGEARVLGRIGYGDLGEAGDLGRIGDGGLGKAGDLGRIGDLGEAGRWKGQGSR